MLGTLRGISTLPDALGKHACEECGHPEMRRLPDGTFHCPACRSEVLPSDASWTPSRPMSTPKRTGQAGWRGASERGAWQLREKGLRKALRVEKFGSGFSQNSSPPASVVALINVAGLIPRSLKRRQR